MDTNPNYDYLEHPIFRDVNQGDLSQVKNHIRTRLFTKGEIVAYDNEASSKLYFIIKGKVKLIGFTDEVHCVKDILLEGDFFGRTSSAINTFNDHIEVLSHNTIISYISISDFSYLLRHCPSFASSFAKALWIRLNRTEEKLEILLMKDVQKRLSRFIQNLIDEADSSTGKIATLPNLYRQSDIADMLCCTRQSVNAFFTKLKSMGLLTYNRSELKIHTDFMEYLNLSHRMTA